MIKIDGITYNIPIMELSRKADVLDKYANRTEDGILHREIIGVYFNYQLKLGSTTNQAEYAKLWDKLTQPEEFHEVTVPDEKGDYTFKAYFSNVSDQLMLIKNGKNYWKELCVNFIAQSPART